MPAEQARSVEEIVTDIARRVSVLHVTNTLPKDKALYFEAAHRLEALHAENEALKRRCADLELVLRDTLCYGSLWRKKGKSWAYGGMTDEDGAVSPSRFTIADDGTGLPALTDEARAALAKGGAG